MKQVICDFEKEIAEIFATGAIKAPVHLRSGREEQLIDIFKRHNITRTDYLFGYWDSHDLCLLKGVPREELKQSILAGNSIALSFPEYRILCSGIVGSLCGVAVGVAWALKQSGSKDRVFHFCGDMSAETGIFHESLKYANNWELPITFIVCDNGLSVMTHTEEVWNSPSTWKFHKIPHLEYFSYKNGYPHSGLGKLIKF